MLDQLYKQIETGFDEACPKQKETVINRNNPRHRGTLKQARLEKIVRYEDYRKERNNTENNTNYY